MPRVGRLVAVLGRRAGLMFGVVTLLVSALLATVNITSRHALKLYVEDQLRRIPWDLAAYQRAAGGDVDLIKERLRHVEGLERVVDLDGYPEHEVSSDRSWGSPEQHPEPGRGTRSCVRLNCLEPLWGKLLWSKT